MPPGDDRDDDIIDISFDDEDEDDGASAEDDDIEIVFHDDEPRAAPAPPQPPPSPRAPAPPPPARRPAPPPPPVEEDLPDDEVKYCPDCGFALPPLTTQCPRCARFGHAPVTREEPPAEFPPVASPGAYPAAASARPRSRVGLLIVAIIMVAIAVAIPFVILNSPGYKARVAYREAVQAQLAGDMETAKAKYRQALDYDPEMGLAAFGLGTACLGISIGGRTDQRMSQLLQSAAVGVTTDLDEADRWFDHSIVLANKMPTNQALQDPNISTPPKLASYAHAMKGLTALIRYYAALQADDFDIANQWLQAASAEIHQSLAFDPTNPYAHDFSGQLTP